MAILMNNYGPYGEDLVDPREQIKFMTPSANCTPIHQPMDTEIVPAWKAKYRRLILRAIVKDVETRQQRRDEIVALQSGMPSISDMYDAHLIDVAMLVTKSWDSSTKSTTAKC